MRQRSPRRYHVGARRLALSVAATVSLLTCSCSPAYVTRAGFEQARILWSREPIQQVLADPNLGADHRAKLELVLDVRRFADESLGLRVAGSYASLARVDEGAIMHVVTAAERLRLAPVTWWFPIVGRVPYKGYFDVEQAQAEAKRLEQRGFDTSIGSAAAFSTLGWFDDPLLSNLLALDAPTLANLILHELLHSTQFRAGDAAFSESFANFVGYRGAVAYFQDRDDQATATAVENEWRAVIAFSDYLDVALTELEAAYAGGLDESERPTRFDAMRRQWQTTAPSRTYPGFGPRGINNAVLLHMRLYHHRLGLFEEVWEAFGRDLRQSTHAIIAASSANGDPFTAVARLLDPRAEANSGLEVAQPFDAGAHADDEHSDTDRGRSGE